MELAPAKVAFDSIIKKQKLSSSRSHEVIDQVGREIEQALAKIQSTDNPMSPVDQKHVLTELKHKLDALGPLNQLEGPQKELNIHLTKYPKLLEKSLTPDISTAYRDVEFDFHIVNQIVASHFYRQGLFDLGDCLINESRESEAAALRSQFWEMHRILDAIKVKNLAPALNWVCNNSEKLKLDGSNIEMKLHHLQFVEILRKGSQVEALNYARTYLAPFASLHMKDFLKLVASLAWMGRLEKYPYYEMLAPTLWDKLLEDMTREFCNLMGQSYGNPLSVAVAAGIEGLPTLLKLANVMAARQQEWLELKQLPVPLDLGKEFQFHSIFICPVSRDRANEDNPPMLLPCLHVLCKQSITKLSKGSSRMFKCPYCPAEASVEQCRQLHF